MRKQFQRAVCAILVAAFLGGCATDAGQKEQAGAVIGTIAGALLGSTMGKGGGRIAATVVGALAGGLVGQQWGRYLDEHDRKKVAEATERAARENMMQTYVSPKSGARVTITPSPEAVYDKGPQLRALPEISTDYPLRAERRSMIVRADLGLQAAPAPQGQVLRTLRRGDPVELLASVPNSSWRLVAKDGVALGYAAENSFVEKAEDLPPLPAAKPARAPTKVARAPARKASAARAAKQESVRAPEPAPTLTLVSTQPQAAPDPATLKTVATTAECRVVTRTLDLPNGQNQGKEQLKMCAPKWELV